MEPNQEEFDDSDYEEFYFESDHLALRGNTDYSSILRTIAILQAQKIQATKDLDQLVAAENEALADPEEFVRKITQNVPLDLPGPINVVEVPKIQFGKYNVNIPNYPEKCKTSVSPVNNDLTVRGRIFDQSKPETFNQLWSNAEQRRLEELLIEFPPEPVEMRRFAKIAKALGNRTTKQVASRLQKYFKKLYSAGFPVPGRVPKRASRNLPPNSQKFSKQAVRPTTFFPAQDVPVTMCDGDDDTLGNPLDPFFFRQYTSQNSNDDKTSNADQTRMDVVDQDLEPDRPNEKDEHKILRLLKRIKNDKDITDRPYSEHESFKCDFCSEEPIIGTRWNCTTCSNSVDFCLDCMITQISNPSRNNHPLDHKFVGIRCVTIDERQNSHHHSEYYGSEEDDEDEKPDFSGNFHDKDYMPHKFSKDCKEYNYMDPNFLPE